MRARSAIQNFGEAEVSKKKPPTNKPPRAVQVTAARTKAAALLATPGTVRLLDKNEVCAIAGVTFPTLWSRMRTGAFPRSRVVGGKSMWRSDEIDAWLAALPIRKLKGDAPTRRWHRAAT
jgi:predicted DNA-binding transcriptional regulator AlpA